MIIQDLKTYYKEIDKALICEKKVKKTFLNELKVNIEQYVKDSGIDNINEIKKHFGSPQEIANSFLGDIDTSALKKQLSIKKVVIVALIVLVIVISLVYILALLDSSYFLKDAYMTEEIGDVEQMIIRGIIK